MGVRARPLPDDSVAELWPRQQVVAPPSAEGDASAVGGPFLELLRLGMEKRLSLCSVLSSGCLVLGASATTAAGCAEAWPTSAEALDSLLVGLKAPWRSSALAVQLELVSLAPSSSSPPHVVGSGYTLLFWLGGGPCREAGRP